MALAEISEDAFEPTRVDLTNATHIGGDFYTSLDIYAREKENIFMRDWLWLAREEEIPNAGDYMTFRIMDEPIIITRNGAGEVHAFANVCAHRGVEVASGDGNTQEFSCPYHGWLYDLDGKLVGAPYMKEAEGFDPASCRLKPLSVARWQGWVLVSFSHNPPDIDEWFADFDRDFDFLRQADCRVVDKIVADVDCNWKFAVENFMDYYHAQVLHADTFGGAITVDKVPFNLRRNGGFSAFYDAAPMAPDNQAILPNMPWLTDKADNFACGGAIGPNVNYFGRVDDISAWCSWPLSPDRTRCIIYLLFPEDHLGIDGLDDIVARYRSFVEAVVNEDLEMVRALQRNMHSRAFAPGRMSKIEKPIHHFVNHNLERIFGD